MYASVHIVIAVVFIVIAILNESRADPESLSLSLKFEFITPPKPGRYTENHKPKVNISRFLEKNRTEKKLIG